MATFGYRVRRARAGEQVAGTEPVAGTWSRRTCARPRCPEPVGFVASWYDDSRPDRSLRWHRRLLCAQHAAAFAARHQTGPLPGPLRVDQPLLPFGGEEC